MRSLSKHVSDIARHNRIIKTDSTRFAKKEINLWDFTFKIIKTLFFFNNNFNNTEIKCLSVACRCGNDVAFLNKFDANRVSILIVKKHPFSKQYLHWC